MASRKTPSPAPRRKKRRSPPGPSRKRRVPLPAQDEFDDVPDHIDVPEIGPVPRKKIPGEPDFESPLETQPRPLRRAKSAGRERPGKVTRTRSKSRIRRKA